MVPLLHNTIGTLNPVNAPVNTIQNSSLSPTTENTDLSSSDNVTRSFAEVASSSLQLEPSPGPHQSFSRRSISKLAHRKEHCLYRSDDIGIPSASQTSFALHKNGSTDHSVFYHVPGNSKSLKADLAAALSLRFPFGDGLGLTHQDIPSGTTIEMSLANGTLCAKALAEPVHVQNHVFHAFPAVSPDRALTRINLTKLPITKIDTLRDELRNNFARYGIVREIVIYLDDWSSSWFTGNGHLYIERPKTGPKKNDFDDLMYKIQLDSLDTYCLATWTKMDSHCVYCKKMGHSRKDCDIIPSETRKCYACHSRGHIARNCPRAKADGSTSLKRPRSSVDEAPAPSNTSPAKAATNVEIADDVISTPPTSAERSVESISAVTPSVPVPIVVSPQGTSSQKDGMKTRASSEEEDYASSTLDYQAAIDKVVVKQCKACGRTDHKLRTNRLCPTNPRYQGSDLLNVNDANDDMDEDALSL